MAPVVESLTKRYEGSWGKLNVVADAAIFTGFILSCVAFAPDQLPGGAEPDCPAGSTFTIVSIQETIDSQRAASEPINAETASGLAILEEAGISLTTPFVSACVIGTDPISGSTAKVVENENLPTAENMCKISTPETQTCVFEPASFTIANDGTRITTYETQGCFNLNVMEDALDEGLDGVAIGSIKIEQLKNAPETPTKIGTEFFVDCSPLYDNMYALVTAAVSVALFGNVLCLVGRIGNRDDKNEPSGWVLGTAYVLYFIPLGLAYGYLYSSDLPGTAVTRQQTAAGLTLGVTALHFIGGAIEATGGFGGGTMLVGSNLDAVRLLAAGAL